MSLEHEMREKYPDATSRSGEITKKNVNTHALRIAGGMLAALIVGSTLVSCGTQTDAAAAGSSESVATGTVTTTASPAPGTTTAPATASTTVAPSPTATVAPATTAEPSADSTATAPQTTQPAAGAGTALAMLAGLDVKGRAPKTGYTREAFGQAWKDVDHNGCDTRNDVLGTQLSHVTYTGSVPCQVKSGTLIDPFSGKTMGFLRGQTTSSLIQIDHVVPLSDAWQKGAQKLDTVSREALANDPMNLVATEGRLNGQKSDSDAASWLPPLKSSRCDYVARQIAVKDRYELWVTKGEHAAMTKILTTCPEQPAITSALKTKKAKVAVAAVKPETAPATAAKPAPVTQQAPAPATKKALAPVKADTGANVFYQNCSAVRAAGADPIHSGEPGYSRKLDRDGDGVGCE